MSIFLSPGASAQQGGIGILDTSAAEEIDRKIGGALTLPESLKIESRRWRMGGIPPKPQIIPLNEIYFFI